MWYRNLKYFAGEEGFIPASISVENGIITKICREDNAGDEQEYIDLHGNLVIPGLVDIHIHGIGGDDFSDGNEEGLTRMAKQLLRNGITGFLPTSMTLPYERLAKAFRTAARVSKMQQDDAARILGINMEGPFLSEKKCGAQNTEFLQLPDRQMFMILNDQAEGMIRIVDVAPELEGAVEFAAEVSSGCWLSATETAPAPVESAAEAAAPDFAEPAAKTAPACRESAAEAAAPDFVEPATKTAPACRVSAAHTAANYDQAARFFDAGARHLTHLFNAMTSIHHRDPGVIGAASERPDVTAELISDGIHVHPGAVRMAFRMFPGRICLISDALRCCGMPEGEYELGGQTVTNKDGVARLADGTIAGAASTLYQNLRNAISFGIPATEAIMASTINPARAIGWDDRIGSIEEGKYADFLICGKDLALLAVVLGGKWCTPRS